MSRTPRASQAGSAITGTIYSLTDPRDGQVRYIGQTTKTLAARLSGGYAPRVRAWIAEVRATGGRPLIAAVREGVPADQLLDAEREEITRILVEGGTLLNEQATAIGRELVRQHEEMAREAAERAAWRELAEAAFDVLGGPLPPGDSSGTKIPEVVWHLISAAPGRRRRLDLLKSMRPEGDQFYEHFQAVEHLDHEHKDAIRGLQQVVYDNWPDVGHGGGDRFCKDLDLNVSVIAEMHHSDSAEVWRHLALTIWYMVAVHPWRHLAEMAGLAPDDETFIAWAGRDVAVREALKFLASRRERALSRIPYRWYSAYEKGPGHMLGAVTAAYSGIAPEAVRSSLGQVLGKIADEHELTQPMADLLLRLKPNALDSIFGRDIAADIDSDLGLPAGTAGSVLQELGKRIISINDPQVRRAIDRAGQALPVVPLPDYRDWSGPATLDARVISASLVRAGLAEPGRCAPADYMAEVYALWVPDVQEQRKAEAA